MLLLDAAQDARQIPARFARLVRERDDVRAFGYVNVPKWDLLHSNFDLELLLVSTDPWEYMTNAAWLRSTGLGPTVQAHWWHNGTEVRCLMQSGLRVRVGVGSTTTWAEQGPREAREKLGLVLKIVHDPGGLLQRLAGRVA